MTAKTAKTMTAKDNSDFADRAPLLGGRGARIEPDADGRPALPSYEVETISLDVEKPDTPPPVPADERWGEPYKYRPKRPAPFNATEYYGIESLARASARREHDRQVEEAARKMRQVSRRTDIELLVRRAPRLPDGTIDYAEVEDMPPPPSKPVRAPLPWVVEHEAPRWASRDDDDPESTGSLIRKGRVVRNFGRKKTVGIPKAGEPIGGGWAVLGRSSWHAPDDRVVMSPEYVAAAFGYRFGEARFPEIRRVVKLTHPSRSDNWLKDAVIHFVTVELPTNRGNREPVATFLGVSPRTISNWKARRR